VRRVRRATHVVADMRGAAVSGTEGTDLA
jgi:hypothetical protein